MAKITQSTSEGPGFVVHEEADSSGQVHNEGRECFGKAQKQPKDRCLSGRQRRAPFRVRGIVKTGRANWHKLLTCSRISSAWLSVLRECHTQNRIARDKRAQG